MPISRAENSKKILKVNTNISWWHKDQWGVAIIDLYLHNQFWKIAHAKEGKQMSDKLFANKVCESDASQHFSVYRNVKLEEVMGLAQRNDIISATEGRITAVQDGPGRNSLDASWHQDGLSYQYPPRTVLLYCQSAGQDRITTDLADVASVFKALKPNDRVALEKMLRCYVSRSGEQVYRDRLVQTDSETGDKFLNLCSRGWVQGDANMTLEQMSCTMYALFKIIQPCHVQSWSEGDCLVFNNYKYLHRRHNPCNIPDPDRRLIRMWFTSDLS